MSRPMWGPFIGGWCRGFAAGRYFFVFGRCEIAMMHLAAKERCHRDILKFG